MSEPDAAEEYADFAAEIADQIESFLVAVREIARAEDTGSTLMPEASIRNGYSLVPWWEPRYLTTRRRRVET